MFEIFTKRKWKWVVFVFVCVRVRLWMCTHEKIHTQIINENDRTNVFMENRKIGGKPHRFSGQMWFSYNSNFPGNGHKCKMAVGNAMKMADSPVFSHFRTAQIWKIAYSLLTRVKGVGKIISSLSLTIVQERNKSFQLLILPELPGMNLKRVNFFPESGSVRGGEMVE